MAMQMMDTAYRPDGPLGALFSGMNAAYAEQAQQLEVIKNFLANQREQASQPFDMMGKEYDGRLAQAKMNDPNYIPMQIQGQIGQMQSQAAAGENAQVLAPFRRNQEKQQSQYDTQKLGVLRTIQDIDSKINAGGSQDEQGNLVPFSPQDKATMQQLRQQHIQQLADTPEFSQKQQLQGERLESNEYIAQLKAQAAQKQLQEPKYKEQLASAIQVLANPNSGDEAKASAQKFIEYDAYLKQVANPRSFAPTINMGQMGVPMNPAPVAAAPAQMPTPASGAPKPAQGGTTIKYDNKGNRIP